MGTGANCSLASSSRQTRWAQDGHDTVAEWDFVVENDLGVITQERSPQSR